MNTAEIEIRPARPDDLPKIKALLNISGLPSDDLTPETLPSLFVTGSGAQILGVAGCEVMGTDALLRSLAVTPMARGQQLGARLVKHCENAAQAAGVKNLYLLTTTAATYLRRLGYADVDRSVVPPAIAAHPQFRGLCPASATCLGKPLE